MYTILYIYICIYRNSLVYGYPHKVRYKIIIRRNQIFLSRDTYIKCETMDIHFTGKLDHVCAHMALYMQTKCYMT